MLLEALLDCVRSIGPNGHLVCFLFRWICLNCRVSITMKPKLPTWFHVLCWKIPLSPFPFFQKEKECLDVIWKLEGGGISLLRLHKKNSRTQRRGWQATQTEHLLRRREKPPWDFKTASPEIISLYRYVVPYELYYYFSWFSLTSHYDFFSMTRKLQPTLDSQSQIDWTKQNHTVK